MLAEAARTIRDHDPNQALNTAKAALEAYKKAVNYWDNVGNGHNYNSAQKAAFNIAREFGLDEELSPLKREE